MATYDHYSPNEANDFDLRRWEYYKVLVAIPPVRCASPAILPYTIPSHDAIIRQFESTPAAFCCLLRCEAHVQLYLLGFVRRMCNSTLCGMRPLQTGLLHSTCHSHLEMLKHAGIATCGHRRLGCCRNLSSSSAAVHHMGTLLYLHPSVRAALSAGTGTSICCNIFVLARTLLATSLITQGICLHDANTRCINRGTCQWPSLPDPANSITSISVSIALIDICGLSAEVSKYVFV